MSYGKTPQQVLDFYKESMRRIEALPGVSKTAVAYDCVRGVMPATSAQACNSPGDGHVHGKDDPRAMWRVISPGFFAALWRSHLAGRDFNALDDREHRSPS